MFEALQLQQAQPLLALKNFVFSPQSVFILGMILTIHSYKALFPYIGLTRVIVIDMQCVSCKRWTEILYIIYKKIHASKVIE